MDTKKESHWWWFDSHNSPKCSPWLESTLAELNEKTKTMLKLVEDDADSFAQRAEMYYKKRPELISMVEDFYRTHRSLAERYDQLRTDRGVRVRSPLSNTWSLPKVGYENEFNSIKSVKSFDSFTEVAYSSEDGAVSEVDDPEEGVSEVDQDEGGKEITSSGWANFDEYTPLRNELDRLREENEILKDQIEQKDMEKDELSWQLSENVNVLEKMRKDLEAFKEDNSFVFVKWTIDEVVAGEMLKVPSFKLHDELEQVAQKDKDEIECMMHFEDETKTAVKLKNAVVFLRTPYMNQEEENIKLANQFETAKLELMIMEDETWRLQDTLSVTERELLHEKAEVTKLAEQLEEVKSELVKLREDAELQNKSFNDALSLKEEQLKHAKDELAQSKARLNKTTKEVVHLWEEMQRKDEHLATALAEKDEEKRAVIRQLSVAMEVLREDNQFLKQVIVKEPPKKSSTSQFQFFKGVRFSKLFTPRCAASAVPLLN